MAHLEGSEFKGGLVAQHHHAQLLGKAAISQGLQQRLKL